MSGLNRRELLTRTAVTGVMLGLPSLAAGCSSTSSRKVAGRPSAGATGTVTGRVSVLVGFGTGNDPSQVPTQQSLAAAFGRVHPGASVAFNRVPDSDTAKQKFTVQLTAGSPPNVVLPIGIFGVSSFLDKDVWLDLAPYLAQSGIDLAEFQAPAARAAKAVAYYGETARTVVGLPSGMFTHAVGYNRDLFAKAGLKEPPHEWNTPEWTYDALLEAATALTRDARGRTPDMRGFDARTITQFGLGHWDTGIMTLGFGGHAYDPGTRRVGYDTPEWIAGTQAGIDLTNKHHVLATDQLASAIAAGASDPQQAAWQAGKVAMVDMCSCDLASYGTGNKFRWDVAAWPRGPKRTVATLNLDVGTIPAASGNHDLAWALLRDFLTVSANTRVLATKGYGAIPALKSEAGGFIDAVRGRYPGVDLQVFLDAIPYCTPETEEWYPAFSEIGGLSTLQPLYDGKVSAAEILPKYQQQTQKLVDSWFSTHHLPGSG